MRNARAWFAKALKHAAEATNYGYVREEYLDPDVLRQAIDNVDQLLAALRAGGKAQIDLADKIERARALALPLH